MPHLNNDDEDDYEDDDNIDGEEEELLLVDEDPIEIETSRMRRRTAGWRVQATVERFPVQ